MKRLEKRVRSGFTLFEMLVSVAVLAILFVLVLQLLSGTTATVTASNKQIDTASLARVVFDRFGDDFSGAILSNGGTALYYSEPGDAGNSAIAFVTTSRARGPSGSTSAWTTDTRSAFIGYRVRAVAQNVGGISTPSIPSLNRGDGRFTFSVQDINSQATFNLWDAFGSGNQRIPNDLTAGTNDQKILNWQIVGSGIFRFHISFVLSDGRVVQTPPSFLNFFANVGTGTCTPIAFSQDTSADLNHAYVKGLIVGIAALDESTRNLTYQLDNNFWTTISTKIRRPIAVGETPSEIWNSNFATLTSNDPNNSTYLFPPARQNLRFYQRFYSVHL